MRFEIDQIAMFNFDILIVTTALILGLIFRKELFTRNTLFTLGTLYLFFAMLWHAPLNWSNLY